MATFRVAGASEYLAITGWGIDDVKLAKKAWVWLGQRCTTLDAAPVSYELVAQGVTSDKFPVVLRAVCTVGPKTDDKKQLGEEPLLLLDAKVLPAARRSNRKLVEGVVEARVRALAAGMTTEQIFAKGVAGFAKEALESAQPELGKYGLRVHSATVERISIHLPANNKVNVVAAAPAAMGLSVQVQGAVGWSSKAEVNLSVATKMAGAHGKMAGAHGMMAGAQGMMAGAQGFMAGAQGFMAGAHGMMVHGMMAEAHGMMAGAQGMMAGAHGMMAGAQVMMPGAQSNMAVVQIKTAGVQLKMMTPASAR